jgi:hypothetical protein
MVAALGQARAGESRLFLKLDCWHVRDLPLFRRAFPDTPWVFLYREPVEVLVSHLRRRGVQMIPELVPSARLGLDTPTACPTRTIAPGCWPRCARRPRATTRRAAGGWSTIASCPRRCSRVLPHFGVAPSDDEAATMRAAGSATPRPPTRGSSPTARPSGGEADDDLRAICERRVGGLPAAGGDAGGRALGGRRRFPGLDHLQQASPSRGRAPRPRAGASPGRADSRCCGPTARSRRRSARPAGPGSGRPPTGRASCPTGRPATSPCRFRRSSGRTRPRNRSRSAARVRADRHRPRATRPPATR